MEFRRLGKSGLQVSALSFGAMTFGGGAMGFGQQAMGGIVGDTGQAEADSLIGLCLDAGINLFDTANAYSMGQSEEILGKALGARRADALIATKAFGQMRPGQNGTGLSRRYLIEACEDSLRRLGTDYIDIYHLHQFDELTPLEETLRALDDLVRAGKVRYTGVSNFTGSQLMKALALSERNGWERCIVQQIYYSLAGREAEWELLRLSRDEGVGTLIWSPLAFGLLSGKFRRGVAPPEGARAAVLGGPGNVPIERVYAIVDVLDAIAGARGVSVAQVALNYILHKPQVDSVIIGARNATQLKDNLAAAAWRLGDEEVKRLDEASYVSLPYPYWHQATYGGARNPGYAALYKG
jgi:aryl-alcohol dehydrogenase-like predicted oxidoreductase